MIKKVFSILLVIAVFLSFFLVPVACTPPGEEEEEEEEGLILVPGGLATGVDGVTIAAPQGVLDQAIEIFIEKVDDPRGEVSFPEYMEEMKIVGDFYEISAGQYFSTSTGDYLLLGLPVPAEVSPDDLMFLSLVRPNAIMQTWPDDDPSHRWGPLQGVYDPDSGLFGTLLPSVSTESDVFVLAEAFTVQQTSTDAELVALQQDNYLEWTDTPRFRVVCLQSMTYQFPPSHREMTGDALEDACDDYSEWGFYYPDLKPVLAEADFDHPLIKYKELWEYWLVGGNPNGWYNAGYRTAGTIYRPADAPPDPVTAHHELFHAIQHSYGLQRDKWHSGDPDIYWDGRRCREAGATLAEMSLTELTRSTNPGRDPHPVDHPLWSSATVSDLDYHAQDFLVYICMKGGYGLELLIDWYETGGLIGDLASWLMADHTYYKFHGLSQAYWDWAKNQAFEKEIYFSHDMWGTTVPDGKPCEWSEHGSLEHVNYDEGPNVFVGTQDFKLQPLSSEVFRLHFEMTNSPYEAIVGVCTDDPDIRWKFYEDGDVGTDICRSRCESCKHTFQVPSGGLSAYLLVSNTHLKDESGSIRLCAVPPFISIDWGDINLGELIGTIIGVPWDQLTPSDVEGIEELNGSGKEISDLSGLEYCTNLEELYLGDNQISDISPLASLINLAHLDLGVNQISDVSPLASLTEVERLWLDWNQIGDLSPLASLTSLTNLALENNQISDISPLANLTSLTTLGLGSNQISDISPLANLNSLEELRLYRNQISDVSTIADLGNLEYLDLSSNQISNIWPLVVNAGLSEDDQVYLGNNPLSEDCIDIYIPALEERGVIVDY